MEKLQAVLAQDHAKKTKKELVELLTGISQVVGDDFDKITGLQVNELQKTNKDDLVAILGSFNENYNADWENNLSKASTATFKTILALAGKDDSFVAADASDADFAAELGSIDFENLIGGPLNACVTAQANASMSTVSFIKEVGFDEDGNLRMVDFSYNRQVDDPDNPGTPITEAVALQVPFVSVLNIPSLRIETCEVDFNVKLNSVYTKDVKSEFGLDAQVSGGWGPVKFKVSASYKRSSSTGVKVEKEYTMGVKVVATNDQMPGGLEKVLGILSE
ncbi:DUF2589 domain-containing protein [Leeuwenhoekiella polynyae]|uniref:DUF2589 domain-containing protein n=1 Tax=Leeuwenhoekiella polynyae TaxID=1550906 RepID=A0A4Q0NQ59_9FLAO|nr:DUF2589 domain-containing protein [Leeuwenhoekiella polynyae]RXG12119.1 putative protein DUF2589 [Leeuwenhoekiella polynyae]